MLAPDGDGARLELRAHRSPRGALGSVRRGRCRHRLGVWPDGPLPRICKSGGSKSRPKPIRPGRQPTKPSASCARRGDGWGEAEIAGGEDRDTALRRAESDQEVLLRRGLMHAFDVLGDPVRRRILELLAEGEHASGEIVDVIQREFGISQPAVSQHLKVLRESGFANVRSEGPRRIYAVDAAPLSKSTNGSSASAASGRQARRARHRNRARQEEAEKLRASFFWRGFARGVQQVAAGFLLEGENFGGFGLRLAPWRSAASAREALGVGSALAVASAASLRSSFSSSTRSRRLASRPRRAFLRSPWPRRRVPRRPRIDLRRRLVLELFQHRLLGGFGGFAAFVVVLKAHASSSSGRASRSALESECGIFGRST